MSFLVSSPATVRFNRSHALLLAVAIVAFSARFIGLAHSPPAMFIDEWIGASHIACMAVSGQSGHGERWPLFVSAGGGGYVTPVYLYFGALWTKLLGFGPAALRSMSASFVALTIMGLALLGKRVGGSRVGFWALVLGCLSPWAFQFSRIAWDPPLAPVFVVWFCYFWLARPTWRSGILCGIMFAGAVYSYPPQRIQMPLLVACLVLLTQRRHQLNRNMGFVLAAAALCFPLAKLYLNPEFLNRGKDLAIFSKAYVEQHRGDSSTFLFLLQTLLDNLALHLRPSFLFISGDTCLRHSTRRFGELGFLDAFAALLGLATFFAYLLKKTHHNETAQPSRSLLRSAVLGVAGILTGLLPAALTWEGLPHALRAIGSWPFFALFGASVLTYVERRWRQLGCAACAVAVLHALAFGRYYFVKYPTLSRDAFWAAKFDEARHWQRLSVDERANIYKEYPELLRYAIIADGSHGCITNDAELRRTLSVPEAH